MMQAILKQRQWHVAEWKVLGLQPTPELVAVSVGMRLSFWGSCLHSGSALAIAHYIMHCSAACCSSTVTALRPGACAAYLVQGLKSQLASLAEQYYLKDLLLFSPAKVQPCFYGSCAHRAVRHPELTGAETLLPQAETWKVIAGLPWVVKPLYGFISDTVPIFGRRRQPYLVACGLVGAWVAHPR